MRNKRAPYNIPTIHESLAADVVCGNITMRQAAEELCRANWTQVVDLERTERLLAPYTTKGRQKNEHDHH